MKIKTKLPSNRSFGILFFVVFLIISLWPISNNGDPRIWAIAISLIFLLLGIKNSKLLLKPSGKINYQKLYKMFENEKVLNQIFFLKNENNFKDHINQYSKVDIALDTFPYNGATTSFEAIWMGVPVLTIKGNNFVGRYGESINTNLGIKNLIVENEDEYINTMIDFANDQKKVENMRDLVFKNALNSTLFDSMNFTKELEKAMDKMISNAL